MHCMCVVFIRLRGPFGPVTCARTRKRRARHLQPFWREPKTLGWGARKPIPDHSRTDLKGHPRKTKRVAPSIRRSLARQQVGEEARSIFPALKKSVSAVKLYKSVFEYSQSEKRVAANKAEWRTFVTTKYSKNRRMQRLQKNLIKTVDHDYRLLVQCVDIVRSLNEDSDSSDILCAISRAGCMFGPGGVLITTAGNLVDNLRRQYLAARTKHRKARKLFYDIMAACRDCGVHPPINAPRHYDFEEFKLSMLDGPFPYIYGMSAEWIDNHKSLVDKHGVGTMFKTFHEYHKLKHLDKVKFAGDVSLTLASLNYDASYATNPFSFMHAHYNKRKYVESRQKFVDEPAGKRWTTKITALSREEARESKYDRSVKKAQHKASFGTPEEPIPIAEQIIKITVPVISKTPVIIREYPEIRWKVTAPRLEPYAHFSPDRCPVKLVNVNKDIHPIFGQKLALVLNIDDTFHKLRTRILHKFPVHTTLDGPGSGIYTWDFKDAEDVPIRQLIYISQQTGNVLVLYCNTLNGTHGEATNEDDLDNEKFHIPPTAVYNRKFLQRVANRAATIEHIARGGPKYMFNWLGDDLEVDHGDCFDFRLVTQLDDHQRTRHTCALCDCQDCTRLSVSHVEIRLQATTSAPVQQMHLPIVHRLSSVRSRVPILELARQIAEHCHTSTIISVTAHVRRREGCSWYRHYSTNPGQLLKDLDSHWQWISQQDDSDDDSHPDPFDYPYVPETATTRTYSGDEGSLGSGSESDYGADDSSSEQLDDPPPSDQGEEEPHDDISDHMAPDDNYDEYLDDLFFGNPPKDLSFYGDFEEHYGDNHVANFPPPPATTGEETPPLSPRDTQLGSSHGEHTEGDDMGESLSDRFESSDEMFLPEFTWVDNDDIDISSDHNNYSQTHYDDDGGLTVYHQDGSVEHFSNVNVSISDSQNHEHLVDYLRSSLTPVGVTQPTQLDAAMSMALRILICVLGSAAPRDTQLGSSHGEITEGDDMGQAFITSAQMAWGHKQVTALVEADKKKIDYNGELNDKALATARRKLNLKFHPDRHPTMGKEEANFICQDLNAACDRLVNYMMYKAGDREADVAWYKGQLTQLYRNGSEGTAQRHTEREAAKFKTACEFPGCKMSARKRYDGRNTCKQHNTTVPCHRCGIFRCRVGAELCPCCTCKAFKCYEARTNGQHCDYHATVAGNGYCANEYCRTYADQPGGLCSKCRKRDGCSYPGCALPKVGDFCVKHTHVPEDAHGGIFEEGEPQAANSPPPAATAKSTSDSGSGSQSSARSKRRGGLGARERRTETRKKARASEASHSERDAGPPTPHPEPSQAAAVDDDDLDPRNVGPAQPAPLNVAPPPPPAQITQDLFHWWYVSSDRAGAMPLHRTFISRMEEETVSRFTPGTPVLRNAERIYHQFYLASLVILTILSYFLRKYRYTAAIPLLGAIIHKITQLHFGMRPLRSDRDLYVHHCYGKLITTNDVAVDVRNPGSQSVRLRAPGQVYAITCYLGKISNNIISPQFGHIFMEQTGQVSLDVAKTDDCYHEGAKDLQSNVKTSTDRSSANHLVNLDRRLQQGQMREEVYYRMRSGHEFYHAASPPLNSTPPKPWASWTEVISSAILLLSIWKSLRLVRSSALQLRNMSNYVRSSGRFQNYTLDMAWLIARWSA